MTNGSDIEAANPLSLTDEAFERYERRRLKAAFSVSLLWLSVTFLHLLAWGQWIVYGLTLLVGFHFLRLLKAHPAPPAEPLPSWEARSTLAPLERSFDVPALTNRNSHGPQGS